MSQGTYAPGPSPVSPRAALVQARQELQLSVADVARHLKLSPAQVEALEAGAYDKLPGRVFARGFLRNYAKLLGLDPQPLLRSLERELPQPAPVEEAPPMHEVVIPEGRRSRWPLYAGLAALVVVVALAVYEFGFNQEESALQSAQAPAGSPARASDPGAQAAAEPASQADAAAAGQDAKPAGPADAPAGALTSARTGEGAPAGTPRVSQPQEPFAAGARTLHFRFEQDSWVEVRDANDKVIFSKLNRAGSEERISAAPPVKLVVGNARGVRLRYGETPVDLTPHIGATVARLTLQ